MVASGKWKESHRIAESIVLLRRAELFSWGGFKTGEEGRKFRETLKA